MKRTTINTLIAIMTLLTGSLFALFNGVDTVRAAYNCQEDYNAYVRNSSDRTNRQNISSCIYETPARNYCNVASHRQADGRNPFEDCRSAYVAGFFGRSNTFSAPKNKETYKFAQQSRADYQAVYESQRGGGSDSSGDASGGSDSSAGDTSGSSGGSSTAAGGSSGDTSTTPEWQGADVGADLSTTNTTISKDAINKAGVVTNLNAENIVSRTLNAVYSIVAVIAVIAIIGAGIMIITSDGDAQKVATGRKAIIYASVGLVITASAFIITGIIQGIAAK